MNRISWFLLVMGLVAIPVYGQLTNSGRDFMFCFPANAPSVGCNEWPDGLLILASDSARTVTVSNRDSTFLREVDLRPGEPDTVIIPCEYRLVTSEVVEDKGFSISAEADLIAYFLSFDVPVATNDMALLFPESSLGNEYIVMAYQDNLLDEDCELPEASLISIVGTLDGTEVTITPTAPTCGGHEGGVPFTVRLDRYQTYQVFANSTDDSNLVDLTGTRIVATHPISVFSGSGAARVPTHVPAADALFEQMPPLTEWGREFLLLPLHQRGSWTGDQLRIVAAFDGTVVQCRMGDSLWTVELDASEQYNLDGGDCIEVVEDSIECTEGFMDEPTHLTANLPILVGQYLVGGVLTGTYGAEGDSAYGDPAFSLVPPLEQYTSSSSFLIPPGYVYNWANVVVPAGHESALTLDGAPVTATWEDMPDLAYRGARLPVAEGGHSIRADAPFQLIIYGYDNFWGSYACVGGQCLRPVTFPDVGPWVEDLTFTPWATDTLPLTLTFGAATGATDAFNPGQDHWLPPPPPNQQDAWFPIDDPLFPTAHRLQRDLRSDVATRLTWRIVTEDHAGLLTWPRGALPNGVFLLNEVHDMRIESTYVYAVHETLRIDYRYPSWVSDTLVLTTGWNLIGIGGRLPEPTPDAVFGAGAIVYGWEPGTGYAIPERLATGKGYWVLAMAPETLRLVVETPDSMTWSVARGWNLLSGPARREVPQSAVIWNPADALLRTWEWDGSAYQPAANLRPGKGYWFLFGGAAEGRWRR